MNDIMGLPPEDLTAVIKAALCNLTVNKPVDTESKKLTRKAAKRGAKLTMAIWAFTLFLAAAAAAAAAATFLIFNMHTKKPAGRDDGSFDIHHTLRQLSQRADAIRAAIHLTGQYNPDFANSVQWMNQVDPSHSQGGLELKDNQIIIPEAGLYFVYSQVSFRVSCRMDDADADAGPATSMVHLTHRVRRWSSSFGDDEYRTILHSVRTACQKTADGDGEQVGGWYSAVYVGAVFNLNRGDRLKTVTEKMLPNLEEEAGKTFFGAFAL
ncbi:tumor necrosis factor a (TNF superfamily, member 2) [Syngnathus scovelli]|uniref:tumor necrosis factor a (TNF superfamily, member 2) n=1 Tax=Syngnathus scovelli TaxID=161590 RepID=UPI00210F8181|nr:tumor necrosis factor a (TNF superfamily, member 2) [Syngnathus scovelli]